MSEYRLKLTAEEIDSRLEQVAENVTEIETLKTNVNDIEGNMLTKNGDSANNITTFTSDDSTDVSAWTDVDVLASGEKHSSIFNKISTMFKNTRYLMKMLGTTDISTLSTDGTVTGGLSALNMLHK